jgi:pimeloyl-ACP methyl ester carboxylesterase
MERKLQQSAEKGSVQVGATEIVTYTWGKGPVVLLVHGWSGRGTQLGAFVAPLVEAGYQVVTFDAPAHGASPGKQTNILEIATSIHAVSEDIGPLQAVVGHSLGAAAILVAETKLGPQADCFVLIGCFAYGRHLTAGFGRLLQIPGPILAQMVQLMHESFEGRLDWDNLSIPDMARTSRVPILIIHDKGDQEIPYIDAEVIAHACTQCELWGTEGLGHYKILRNAAVVEQVVSFVRMQHAHG